MTVLLGFMLFIIVVVFCYMFYSKVQNRHSIGLHRGKGRAKRKRESTDSDETSTTGSFYLEKRDTKIV